MAFCGKIPYIHSDALKELPMSQDSGLTRELGVLEATAIGLGAMIGGGIFILPSIAAAQAGPASMLSFGIAGAISLLAALSHAELATDQPKAGGSYQYVNKALGPLYGSIVGLGMWIGLIFASAFYANGFAQYLTYLIDGLPIVGSAIVLSLALVALNYYGASGAGLLQDLIVVTLLVMLGIFIIGGLFSVDLETFQPVAPEGSAAIISTTGTVYVALIGFSLIAATAGSIERPARNLPLSMIVSVMVPTILYVLVMFVSTGVLPADEVAASSVPVATVAAEYLGGLGALMMVLGAVLATVSSANVSILSAGRVSYSMGEDRVLTSWFRESHDTFGSPYRAIVVTGVGLIVLVWLNIGLELLAEVASFMFLVAYALVHVALLKFRHDDSIAYDPEFTIPDRAYPYVPVVGILSILVVMTQMQPIVIAGGVGLIIIGFCWYLVYVNPDRTTLGQDKDG